MMRRVGLVVVLCLYPPGGLLMGQSADQLFAGGRQAFTDGLWSAASSQFSRLIREYPEDHRVDSAAYMGAVAYFNAGEFRRCIEVLISFPRRYPNSGWNRRVAYWEAMAQFELGEWNRAALAFERQAALTEEPVYSERSLLYLGACRENLGEWGAAEEAYSRIVESGRDYDTLARAVFRLGQIRLAQGRVAEALEDFTMLAYSYPGSDAARNTEFWLGECHRSLGNDGKALDAYRNFLATVYESEYRSQALLEAARLSSQAGEDDDALAYLDLREDDEIPGADEHRHTAVRIRAISSLRVGRLADARRAFGEILKSPRDSEEEQTAAFNLAQTWIGTDQAPRAVAYLARSAKGPDEAIAADSLYLAGTIALLAGDAGGVGYLDLFARRFPGEPRREEALRLAVKTRRTGDEPEKALEGLDILVADYPQSARAESYLFLRGEILFGIGRESDALSDYAALLRSYPESSLAVDANSRIGFIYAGRGEHVRAAGFYLDAAEGAGGVRGGETGRQAVYAAAVSLLNGGDSTGAATQFGKLAESDPAGPWGADAAFHFGEIRYQAGDFDAARRSYGTAAKHGDASLRFEALYGLAWSWFRESNWKRAEEAFLAAAAQAVVTDDAARSRYRAGLSVASAGRWEDALAAYDAALDSGTGPWREEALYQEAWALLNLARIDDAIASAKELAREFPGSALPADLPFRMGEMAMETGDYDDALLWFDRTSAEFPGTEQARRSPLRSALAAREAGRPAEAASRYGEWIYENIDDPGAVAAARSWADALKETGDPELAEKALDGISSAGSSLQLTAPILLAWTRVLGLPATAAEGLEAIAEDESLPAAERAEALLLRAHLYRREGLGARSRQIYEVLIRDVPGRIGAEAQEGLAGSYADEGNIDKAAEAYLAVPYLFPEHSDLASRSRREAERLYREAGRIDEADKIRAQFD